METETKELNSYLAQLLAPPRELPPLLDWCRELQIVEGENLGPYDPEWHPAQAAYLREFQAQRWHRIVWLKPVQDGGSTTVAAAMLYTLSAMRQSCVYATTDKGLSAKLYKAKIKPMAIASKLGHLLPQEGSGSGTGTPESILWETGAWLHLFGAGAQNGAGQAAVTAWGVFIDEGDKLRPKQRELIFERAKSFSDGGMLSLFGTLDLDDDSGIMSVYKASTGGRLYYPCPHCNGWGPLEFSNLSYEGDNVVDVRASATYTCPLCKVAWSEAQRRATLRHGKLVHAGQTVTGSGTVDGEPPISKWCGIRHTGLDSPLRRLEKLAEEDFDSKMRYEKTGDAEPRRRYVHGEKVETYKDDGQGGVDVDDHALAVKSAQSPYALGEFRSCQRVYTAAIDVQWRKLFWMICATDPQTLSMDIVHHGMLPLSLEGQNASREQLIAGLGACATTICGLLPEGGKLAAAGVDISDGTTADATLYWLAGNPEWFGIRGKAERSLAKTQAKTTPKYNVPAIVSCYRSVDKSGSYTVAIIHVDNVKADILRSLPKPISEAGSVNLPNGEASTGRLIRELTAEQLRPTPTGLKWVKRRADNHRLDLAVYNRAMSRIAIDCTGAGGDDAPTCKAQATPTYYMNGF